MEKNHKKDLEHLLIKQIEKILLEIDPATTVIFSKNIKSHCKDLAKKFLKTQRKFQKQLDSIALKEASIKSTPVKEEKITIKTKPAAQAKKIQSSVKQKATASKSTTGMVKKAAQKGIRKGNNLSNAAAVQNKAKAKLAKNISQAAKK